MAVSNGKRIMLTGDTGISLKLLASIVAFLVACGGVAYGWGSEVLTRLDRIETNQIITTNNGWDKIDDEAHIDSLVVRNGLASVPHVKAAHCWQKPTPTRRSSEASGRCFWTSQSSGLSCAQAIRSSPTAPTGTRSSQTSAKRICPRF